MSPKSTMIPQDILSPTPSNDSPRWQIFMVEGMHCGACVAKIETHIAQKFPDLEKVSVDLITKELRIHGDAPVGGILKALSDLGYTARLVAEDFAAEDADTFFTEEELPPDSSSRDFWTALILTLPLLVLHMPMALGWVPHHVPALWGMDGLQWLLATALVLTVGWRTWVQGFQKGLAGQGDMDTLIALGTAVAYGSSVVGLWVPTSGIPLSFETVGVIFTFVLLGKKLEASAIQQAATSLQDLAKNQRRTVTVLLESGPVVLRLNQVQPGDLIAVSQGESIPADGVVTQGLAQVDESMWTGESLPVAKAPGQVVDSGTIVVEGTLTVKVTSPPGNSRQRQMIRTVSQALSEKPPIQRLADTIARWFTLGMFLTAALTALAWLVTGATWGEVFKVTTAVLVVACPCAFGLATPLAIRLAAGKLLKNGVILHRIQVLDTMARMKTLLLDKTGTLTFHTPTVKTVVPPAGVESDQWLQWIASLESFSQHPYALAMVAYCKDHAIPLIPARLLESIPGQGITGELTPAVGETLWMAIGQRNWVLQQLHHRDSTTPHSGDLYPEEAAFPLWAAVASPQMNGVGRISLEASLNPTARTMVEDLKAQGVSCELVSGDTLPAVEAVAHLLGDIPAHARQSPEDKQTLVKARILQTLKQPKPRPQVGMLGDGINDALALAEAQVSIAAVGRTDWIDAVADVVLTQPDLSRIPWMVKLARQTGRVIRQNFVWACGFNLICVPLAAFGILEPMWAAAAMSLSSVAVAHNSLKILKN